MSSHLSGDPDAPATEELAGWVDEIADRFEEAWKALTPPSVEEYLGSATGERRAALREELVKIDRAYRRRLAAQDHGAAARPPDPTATQDTRQAGRTPVSGEPTVPGPARPALADYEVLAEVGHGGMGVVYQARQKSLPRLVALKMMPPGADAGLRQRFLTEARAVARLQHPNIVQIHEVGEHDGQPFFALEYVAGGSLSRRISGALPPARVAAGLVETLARAVAYAHRQGIVHRDLKPANVLLAGGAELPLEQCVPKIADFGLAKLLGDEGAGERTRTGLVLGTPSYMAPEQAGGKPGEVGPAADIYALGAILYELLTGRPPFVGELMLDILEQVRYSEPVPPSRLQPRLQRDLSTICLKALSKLPARRYASAGELADDLRRFLDGKPIQARPVGWLEKLGRWCGRKPVVAGLTAAVAVSLLGLTVAALWAGAEARDRAEAASARERERRREALLQEIRLVRSGTPTEGWFVKAWDRVREATNLDPQDKDHRLRYEAVGTLAGLDSRVLKDFQPDRHFGQDASSVAFSPDGKRLLIGGANDWQGQPLRGARVWHRRTNELHTSQKAGAGPVAFRPDGTPLQVVPGQDSRSLAAVVAAAVWAWAGPRFTAADCSLALWAANSAIPTPSLLVWDVARQRLVAQCRFDEQPHVKALVGKLGGVPVAAVSADGSVVAAAAVTAKDVGLVAAWETASGRRLFQAAAEATALGLSADGARLAVGDRDGWVRVWSVLEGEVLARFPASRLAIHSLAFSPDGKRLAVGGRGGVLSVWNWQQRRPLRFCQGSSYDVYALTFSPDGSLLASAGRYSIWFWDPATGRALLIPGGGDYTVGLAFSPDGRLLARGSLSVFARGRVRVNELEYGRGVRTLHGLSAAVDKVVFSPNGQQLAALSRAWQVAIWDHPSGRLRHLLDVPRGGTTDNAALAFSPDGRYFAFAAGREAVLWDMATGERRKQWPLRPGYQDNMAFDPSGKRLLLFRVETRDGEEPFKTDYRKHPRVCRIRDLLSAAWDSPLFQIREFNKRVFWAAAAPDGSYFVVRGVHHGADGERWTIRAYEALTGKELFYLPADRRSQGNDFVIDPTGKIMLAQPDSRTPVVKYAMPSGERLVGQPLPSSLGPGAAHWVETVGGPPPVSYLRRRGDRHPLAPLGMEFSPEGHVGVSAFNPAGTHVACGGTAGPLSLCDLEAIRRRLATIGLGW